MHLAVLSGGVGGRLWPESRKKTPKQFMKVFDSLSILQNTLKRGIETLPRSIINVTNSSFLERIQKELNEVINHSNIHTKTSYILEPFGKNTAAAVAMTCLLVKELYDADDIILVLPSDHFILMKKEFNEAVSKAKELAINGKIVTFGIKPTSAETGYGYIEFEDNVVKNFIEKPSIAKAISYSTSGKHLWNSGMVCFKASVMLKEMYAHCPDIIKEAKTCFDASKIDENNLLKIDPNTFSNAREDSIDYAVLEKTDLISVVPCDIGWTDIGNWDAISKVYESDLDGNVINAEAITEKVKDCYIKSSNRLIAAVGIENLAIIDTPDALLVANKTHAQDVKTIYNALVKSGHKAHELHTTDHRPWGSYTIIEEGDNFKIKRIEVNPLGSLSFQSHKHRAEHWVVVEGNAHVINGEQSLYLDINQSTYIAAGSKHRLSNPSSEAKLVIIEIQTGDYLGEDDIERFEDIYGR